MSEDIAYYHRDFGLYEKAEHSFAKNHAQEALEDELFRQGIDLDADFAPDVIDLANAVVGRLIEAGVTIPEGISDPHSVGGLDNNGAGPITEEDLEGLDSSDVRGAK